MQIPRQVRTIGELVRWIADTHHEGAVFPIAARARLSAAIIARWGHDAVKTPRLDSVIQLAEAYSLDSRDVLTLVYRALEDELARQRKLMTRELTRRRRPRAPIAGGSGAAQPLPAATSPKQPPSYRH